MENEALRAQLAALLAERDAFAEAAAAGQLPDARLVAPSAAEVGRRFVAPSAEDILTERRAKATASGVAEMKDGWRLPKAV